MASQIWDAKEITVIVVEVEQSTLGLLWLGESIANLKGF
jgi:hypothetical protein